MRKLVYLSSANRDILDILDRITRESGSLAVGLKFTNSIKSQCKKLASLSGTLGRSRPELRPDIRSFAFKNYIIFFRYLDNTFEIVNILEGHRDLESFYSKDSNL